MLENDTPILSFYGGLLNWKDYFGRNYIFYFWKKIFFKLSAVSSGVKEVREVIEDAKNKIFSQKSPILFIDEIHRFNKSQQDSLLHAVEKGWIVLIGFHYRKSEFRSGFGVAFSFTSLCFEVSQF